MAVTTNNPNNPPQTSEPVFSIGATGQMMNAFGFSWYQWFGRIARVLFAPVSSSTPATSSSAGVPGQISFDSHFLYVCISANSWRRVPLTAF